MPTALIVEDDPDQAEMAARLLRYRNFDSNIASTGGAGLSMARSLKPDVILLDLMLPDTTGFDVCRGLRADRETMLTPVVMLTGHVSMKNLSGPLSIAEYAGDSAARGAVSFLYFLVVVSLALGFMNLLPIPILDGGQIVFQTIE